MRCRPICRTSRKVTRTSVLKAGNYAEAFDTYADLCDIYTDFKKYTIPELYAYVLNGPQVRDGTVLQEYLANCIETAKQTEQITTEQRDSLWGLTDQYVYKNADLLKRARWCPQNTS